MADESRRDLPTPGEPRPSLRETVTATVLAEVLSAVGEGLRTPGPEKLAPRPHWEDVVDMNAPAFPLKKNPSA